MQNCSYQRINSPKWTRMFAFLIFLGNTLLFAQEFADSTHLLSPVVNGFKWGCSTADVNNDGLLDLYHDDRLYLNKGAAGFVDVLASIGIHQGSNVFGAAFGDYNNDGYLDILFEDFGPPSKLYRNDNRMRFTHVNAQTGLNVIGLTQGAAWGDYDLDGTLDLYVNEDTGDNQIFKNNNHETFTEMTIPAGVVTQGNSYGTAWGDYNNDGYPDIFIATCNSSPFNSIKHLLKNNGDGTFTDENYNAGVADSLASWGIVWIDYDNDGYLDLYITNSNHNPRPGHNKLYRNSSNGTFEDISAAAGVQGISAESSYGVAAADFDNDGWCDLYVANDNHRHRLYKNNNGRSFSDISIAAGITEDSHRAVAVGDFDNDGWMDIFTAGGPKNRLMMNKGGTNNWIKINARGISDNYYGVGTRVEVYTGSHFQMREIRAGDSFCSQNDLLSAHFGLGQAATVDSIIFKWPTGMIDVLTNVAANQHITLAQGVGIVSPPMNLQLASPEDNETVHAASKVHLSWHNMTPGVPAAIADSIKYNLHIWGDNLDTVITNIKTESYAADAGLMMPGQEYSWMVEGSDGYSVYASREIRKFTHDLQGFEKISGASIVNDNGYSEGGSWGDYNLDGRPDLFVGNIINQNNLLFDNNGDGSFNQVSSGPVVTDGGFSYGGHFVDYDDDGDLDLYVINRDQNNFLYVNDNGTLVKNDSSLIVAEGGASWSGAWADYDNDGLMDLFVANFDQVNFLYHNLGNGNFERIQNGAIATDANASIGCTWGDFDMDGDLDLFVATIEASQNNDFYENNGDGTFTKRTDLIISSVGARSIGASWGDYDNDGDADLYVTNYFDENNFLYQNNGNGTFTAVTDGDLVNDGGLSVGSNWGDFDLDGDMDLMVTDDGGANNLYENNGDGTFSKVRNIPVVTDISRSNGLNWIDIDADGDLDIFVNNGDNAPQSNFLYMNQISHTNAFLNIQLKGNVSNDFGIGAKVWVKANTNGSSNWQMQEMSTQNGYNSQNGYALTFGLGNASQVDSAMVVWPSGKVQHVSIDNVNQFLTIEEDSIITVGIEGTEFKPDQFALAQNYPNPFNPFTTFRYQLAAAADVRLRIFNVLGQEVRLLVNQRQEAGIQTVNWNGRDANGIQVQSGIYFYRLEAAEFSQTRKMMLIR